MASTSSDVTSSRLRASLHVMTLRHSLIAHVCSANLFLAVSRHLSRIQSVTMIHHKTMVIVLRGLKGRVW